MVFVFRSSSRPSATYYYTISQEDEERKKDQKGHSGQAHYESKGVNQYLPTWCNLSSSYLNVVNSVPQDTNRVKRHQNERQGFVRVSLVKKCCYNLNCSVPIMKPRFTYLVSSNKFYYVFRGRFVVDLY